MTNNHLPECPKSRYRDNECICDLLKTVREAARQPKRWVPEGPKDDPEGLE